MRTVNQGNTVDRRSAFVPVHRTAVNNNNAIALVPVPRTAVNNNDSDDEEMFVPYNVFARTRRLQRLEKNRQRRIRNQEEGNNRGYRRIQNLDYDVPRRETANWSRKDGLCVNRHGNIANCSSLLNRYTYKTLNMSINHIPLTLLMGFDISIAEAVETDRRDIVEYVLKIIPYVRQQIERERVISDEVVIRFINNMEQLIKNVDNLVYRQERTLLELLNGKYSTYVQNTNIAPALQEILNTTEPIGPDEVLTKLREILRIYETSVAGELQGYITGCLLYTSRCV